MNPYGDWLACAAGFWAVQVHGWLLRGAQMCLTTSMATERYVMKTLSRIHKTNVSCTHSQCTGDAVLYPPAHRLVHLYAHIQPVSTYKSSCDQGVKKCVRTRVCTFTRTSGVTEALSTVPETTLLQKGWHLTAWQITADSFDKKVCFVWMWLHKPKSLFWGLVFLSVWELPRLGV